MDTVVKDNARAFLFRGSKMAPPTPRSGDIRALPQMGQPASTGRAPPAQPPLNSAYRIAMLRDATYGSGIIPIVICNPGLLDLP